MVLTRDMPTEKAAGCVTADRMGIQAIRAPLYGALGISVGWKPSAKGRRRREKLRITNQVETCNDNDDDKEDDTATRSTDGDW